MRSIIGGTYYYYNIIIIISIIIVKRKKNSDGNVICNDLTFNVLKSPNTLQIV